MTTREAAPLSRGLIDESLPWLRALLGLAFVAYSANSTIFLGASHLMFLFESTKATTIGGFADAYWYSGAIALLLFVGEVATAERYPRTYRIFLVPDMFYTGLGVFTGLSKALIVLMFAATGYKEAAQWIGWLLAFPVAGVLGYFIAKWGEVLLFGRRRQPRRSKEA